MQESGRFKPSIVSRRSPSRPGSTAPAFDGIIEHSPGGHVWPTGNRSCREVFLVVD